MECATECRRTATHEDSARRLRRTVRQADRPRHGSQREERDLYWKGGWKECWTMSRYEAASPLDTRAMP